VQGFQAVYLLVNDIRPVRTRWNATAPTRFQHNGCQINDQNTTQHKDLGALMTSSSIFLRRLGFYFFIMPATLPLWTSAGLRANGRGVAWWSCCARWIRRDAFTIRSNRCGGAGLRC